MQIKIVVVGSINMDIVNRVRRHPLPGETIKGLGTAYLPGGKGANQAVAAARCGSHVSMIGAVGGDSFGPVLVQSLEENGIKLHVDILQGVTSGLAFITVDETGENQIILSEGANAMLTAQHVAAHSDVFAGASVLLLQNEVPWEASAAAMRLARDHDVRVLYNPAPAQALPEEAYPLIDVLILNESEAEELTGLPAAQAAQAMRAAQSLVARGIDTVIVTRGEEGALLADAAGSCIEVPAFRVKAVDTTAAGDTFIGCYAVASAEGYSSEDSLRLASAAAALTVTRPGAQESIPQRAEVESLLEHWRKDTK
ncbi:ribokinase [Paenibacillus turpanensis]|uniref:ribokinase n=1 Tax=Paenibacillus turpanensis TaxID=2689078 RepID=UPI001FB6E742|nr:ribokinase [Paenibacillus turpanensis]